MTRESLIDMLKSTIYTKGTQSVDRVLELLDTFFDSNVVIPRGETLQYYDGIACKWVDKVNIYNGTEYRIKPSEPVWEYQFVYIKADNTAELTQFFTDEEAKDCYQWIKLQETKRERL